MIQFDMHPNKSSIIKVLGVGGGGGNAVNHMFSQQIQNVDFIVCNTDAQALAQSPVPNKIQLGPNLTQGLGAGANPEIGKQATEESLSEIKSILETGTKMVFITAGMGGGTGTGGAPAVAKICKQLNLLTVAIVTTPFDFEGPRRLAQAQAGLNELKDEVDTLLVISNDKLRQQYGNLKMKQTFAKADDVLSTAARCITDVINNTGQMNLDFADVCTVMRKGGRAIMGNAQMSGPDRAIKAIEAAINSPLLNDCDISGAKWILLNILSSNGDFEYTMEEVQSVQQYVRQQAGENADVILGLGYDDSLGDQLGITIIATGFNYKDPFAKPEPKKVAPVIEKPIVMILGVEGEEQKMFANPQVAPVSEVPQPAPAVPEMPQPEAVSVYTRGEEPNPETAEAPEAVFPEQMNQTASGTTQDGPLFFELDVNISGHAQQSSTAINQVTAPVRVEVPRTHQDQNGESAVSPSGFLHKPSRIYQEPAKEAAMPFMAAEDETPAPIETEIAGEQVSPLQEITLGIQAEAQDAEDINTIGLTLKMEEESFMPKQQGVLFDHPSIENDLSEEEQKKKRAAERINRLRTLSFNPLNAETNSQFENEPAYMRRNTDLHNSIANVEDFYSRAQVSTSDNKAVINTLNNFLHGDRPD